MRNLPKVPLGQPCSAGTSACCHQMTQGPPRPGLPPRGLADLCHLHRVPRRAHIYSAVPPRAGGPSLGPKLQWVDGHTENGARLTVQTPLCSQKQPLEGPRGCTAHETPHRQGRDRYLLCKRSEHIPRTTWTCSNKCRLDRESSMAKEP